MGRYFLLAMVMMAMTMTAGAAVTGAPDGEQRSVSVSGTVAVRAVPDSIVWHVSTTSEHPDLQAAKGQSDSNFKAVTELIRELGVAPEDVQAGRVNISREYHRGERGERGAFKHFTVRRSVDFTQRDLKRFDEVLEQLVSRADVEVNFTFNVSNRDELRWGARRRAVEVAKVKATEMVEAGGAHLGPLLTLEEEATPLRSYPSGRAFGVNDIMNANMIVPAQAGSAQAPDLSEGTIAPGTELITVTVEATFAIVD